jgi:Sulfotransferase domain
MSLDVIGAGVGRTGTYSLKLALEKLGMGPCHHMQAVLHDMPAQVPPWQRALDGHPDWQAIYRGYNSAVDWPTAGFFRELYGVYPSAKFVLTVRSPESWAESFSDTIYKALAGRAKAPEQAQSWLAMVVGVVAKTGFPAGLDVSGLAKAFVAHADAVKATVPSEQLLVFQVKDGWEPLCEFLRVPVPNEPFPRTNDRIEFWDRVEGRT